MRVYRGNPLQWEGLNDPSSVTLGVFDGVHLGHRELIARAARHAGTRVIITFDPHPIEVLAPGTTPHLLTTIEERVALLEGLGTEVVVVLDLSDVRHLSPDEFVRLILIDRLNLAALAVGADFHFGRDRAGDVPFLRKSADDHGFDLDIVELVDVGDRLVSSSRIRDLVAAGQVGTAAELLGSWFQMTNVVVDGDKRGRTIGFPTANLDPVPNKVLPEDGVYATRATVRGNTYLSATNVGTRPTFGPGRRLVEAYLFDFDEDIYGEDLTLQFVDRLRPELKFESVDELVARMHDDVARSREILSTVTG